MTNHSKRPHHLISNKFQNYVCRKKYRLSVVKIKSNQETFWYWSQRFGFVKHWRTTRICSTFEKCLGQDKSIMGLMPISPKARQERTNHPPSHPLIWAGGSSSHELLGLWKRITFFPGVFKKCRKQIKWKKNWTLKTKNKEANPSCLGDFPEVLKWKEDWIEVARKLVDRPPVGLSWKEWSRSGTNP